MIPAEQPQSTVADSSYRNRLYPWCIIQLLPNMQRLVVRRFRRRNEAEESLRVLQSMNLDRQYQIVFDPPEQLEMSLAPNNSHLAA